MMENGSIRQLLHNRHVAIVDGAMATELEKTWRGHQRRTVVGRGVAASAASHIRRAYELS